MSSARRTLVFCAARDATSRTCRSRVRSSVTFVRSLLAHAAHREHRRDGSRGAPERAGAARRPTSSSAPCGPPPFPGDRTRRMGRPLVASDRVRFVGDIVAVVVSDDRATGADAAELVFVDYDPLPVVVDPDDAAKDEVLLFPEAGTNVACLRSGSPEHDEQLFADCEVVVVGQVGQPAHGAVPARAALGCRRGRRGRPAHPLALDADAAPGPRRARRDARRSSPRQIRVIGPTSAAASVRRSISVEEILVGWLARRLGRPVRWTETRSESMVALLHGRAQRLNFTIGGTRDGKVLAYRLDSLQDSGAYARARRVPAEPDGADGERRLRDPADRVRGFCGRRRTRRRSPPSAVPAAPRRRRRSSVRSTCSRPSSGSTRPRSGGGTSFRRTRSRTRPCPARTTTRATTRARSTWRCGRPATTSCAPSRRQPP